MAITMDKSQLNSGMRCAKYMLLIISFMFAITAILLILVGTTIQAIFGDFRQFIDDHFLSPPALLIASGVIMFFVAVLGSYGAIKESVLLINLYGCALFLIFILEVASAIAAFVLQGEVRVMLLRTMNDSLYGYEDNEYLRNGVDYMQQGLECCGINSPADWKPVWSPNQNVTEENYFEIFVPQSCCGKFQEDECLVKYEYGCLNRMAFVLSQSAMLIATGATTVAFVQLLGVLCAFMLAKTLRRNKSIREARRWQLQQSLGLLISGYKIETTNPSMGYTQLEKSEKNLQDPETYTASSPSVN